MSEFDIQEVKDFYDKIGWKITEKGVYQNARYEDLRPVSRNYIHKCHLRVNRHLKHQGKFILDAGSGPIQYPEYLTYSKGYAYRVCLDLSFVALLDARKRIGDHGLFVVADVTNLPFANCVFDDIVSLHTLHHLPVATREKVYGEIFRTLIKNSNAVIINGWQYSPLMAKLNWLIKLSDILRSKRKTQNNKQEEIVKKKKKLPKGTFVQKLDARKFKKLFSSRYSLEIFVWRSVSVQFLRSVIHTRFGGKLWLALLYWFEELFPSFFGEKGQYPMIILKKV